MIQQATIKYPIRVSGVGLHNGKSVDIVLRPANVNSGVIFRRIDLDEPLEFKVSPELVKETTLCTTLVLNGHKVATIEHLMSALYGLGIDNILIDINAPEVPILDGSASEFIFILQSVGIQLQTEKKRFVRILEPIKVYDKKGGWAQIEPYKGFKLSFSLDFNHPSFQDKDSVCTIDFSQTSYLKELSRARTFGFQKDVEMLHRNNMALGGSVNNAIVLDESGPVNKDGFRINEEPVKHKLLDAVGDLYVFGQYIIGSYSAHKSGHALNNKLLCEMIKETSAWTTVTFDREQDIPINFIQSKVA